VAPRTVPRRIVGMEKKYLHDFASTNTLVQRLTHSLNESRMPLRMPPLPDNPPHFPIVVRLR
jgi:hypothetical protein